MRVDVWVSRSTEQYDVAVFSIAANSPAFSLKPGSTDSPGCFAPHKRRDHLDARPREIWRDAVADSIRGHRSQ
jgi:hypothetical protein